MKSPLLLLLTGSAALVAFTAGCQLLLPSEDDASTSNGGGGARSSSSGAMTTKATTTGKGSSSGDASSGDASSSVGTPDTTAVGSTSTGGEPCTQGQGCAVTPPTFDVCPSPQLCQAIGGDDWCDSYCRSVAQKCGNSNEQFEDPGQCCAACEYVRAHPGLDNACCRAEALNQDSGLGAQACTVAGPMGTHSNTSGDACGTQAQHVCGLFNKLCSEILDKDCITTNRCMQNFGDNAAEVYGSAGTGPMTSTMQHLVKAVVAAPGVGMECEAAAVFACAPLATMTGSSATGVNP